MLTLGLLLWIILLFVLASNDSTLPIAAFLGMTTLYSIAIIAGKKKKKGNDSVKHQTNNCSTKSDAQKRSEERIKAINDEYDEKMRRIKQQQDILSAIQQKRIMQMGVEAGILDAEQLNEEGSLKDANQLQTMQEEEIARLKKEVARLKRQRNSNNKEEK
jgi:hypothetical protein